MILVPPLFIEGKSHSYNLSIFVFAGATVPYELVIFFDNGQRACMFLIGKMYISLDHQVLSTDGFIVCVCLCVCDNIAQSV